MVEEFNKPEKETECCTGDSDTATTSNNFLDEIRETLSNRSQAAEKNDPSAVKTEVADKNAKADANDPADVREKLQQLLRDFPGRPEKLLDKPADIAAEIAKNGLSKKAVESIKAQMGHPLIHEEGKKDIIAEVNKELAKNHPNLKLELQRNSIIPDGGYRIGNDVQVSVALMDGNKQKGDSAPLYKYFMNY